MPRGRPEKGRFDALDQDFKEALSAAPVDEIKKRVAEIALDLDRLLEAKKADQDLAEKLEAAKDAGAVYRDGTKMARLKIRYAQTLLEARGITPVPV